MGKQHRQRIKAMQEREAQKAKMEGIRAAPVEEAPVRAAWKDEAADVLMRMDNQAVRDHSRVLAVKRMGPCMLQVGNSAFGTSCPQVADLVEAAIKSRAADGSTFRNPNAPQWKAHPSR